ncbi:hypothetical protein [Bradyrhizobium valentinum]|uniref:hypothetical protein n=1 Tax=Bradyrhizobium valentinum TaxID=1518501 RepID=UPI00070E9B03|nr:hypothetical protein [Bradyrhizobium valentinum]KRQ92838.1 hypothetical protein CQ10_36515 [Bradyrhizobium valentinum]
MAVTGIGEIQDRCQFGGSCASLKARQPHTCGVSNTRRPIHVIACDKREAFAQRSDSDEAIHASAYAGEWIASLRSQ